jgi:hypothetical protein
MHRASLVLGTVAALITTGLTGASADPGEDGHGHADHTGAPELPAAPPSVSGMPLVGNSDKDGTTNSDLAFYGNYAFSGNYDGFRILDISSPEQPTVLSDYVCRGAQGDVSVTKLGKRLMLFVSVDRAQTKASCDGTRAGSSADTPLVQEGTPARGYAGFGFEGIRVFDVTNPRRPRYVTAVPTACGSHTHTLVPDKTGRRALIYVSSYPLGSGVTAQADRTAAGALNCVSPHQKISIVEVTARAPERARVLREEPLSSDSRTYAGAVAGNPQQGAFIACHDITVFMATNTALGACAGDAQIWDISNPENPSASDGERHTHIRMPAAGGTRGSARSEQARADQWEFVHNAIATYDGRIMAFADETGGGGTNECDGSAEERGGESENGFYYFYPMVRPGAPAPPLLSRFMIPRPQGAEICVMHNGNVVPTDEGYYLVTAAYQGGDSVVDFTDPLNPREVAHADRSDAAGEADSWSTYWYNDYAYTNGGLNRRGAGGNRGFDVAEIFLPDGTQLLGEHQPYLNPQTIEPLPNRGRTRVQRDAQDDQEDDDQSSTSTNRT